MVYHEDFISTTTCVSVMVLYAIWFTVVFGLIFQIFCAEKFQNAEVVLYIAVGLCPAAIILRSICYNGWHELALGGAAYIGAVLYSHFRPYYIYEKSVSQSRFSHKFCHTQSYTKKYYFHRNQPNWNYFRNIYILLEKRLGSKRLFLRENGKGDFGEMKNFQEKTEGWIVWHHFQTKIFSTRKTSNRQTSDTYIQWSDEKKLVIVGHVFLKMHKIFVFIKCSN